MPSLICTCRYDTVAKLGIASAKQHLQSSFPDGIALDTAFVSSAVLHQLDAAAEDAVASGSWCDTQALLPSALTADDATALLEHCPFMQATGICPLHSRLLWMNDAIDMLHACSAACHPIRMRISSQAAFVL